MKKEEINETQDNYERFVYVDTDSVHLDGLENYSELLKVVNRSDLYKMLNDFNNYVEKYGENSGWYYMREKVINEIQNRKEEL